MSLTFDDDARALGRVLASLPEIVVVVDLDGIIRYINRVELGYDRNQVIGSPAEEFILLPSKEAFSGAIASVLASGGTEEFETEAAGADGAAAWYRCRIYPYREGDRDLGVVIEAVNITELKAAQEMVSRLRRLLPICAWCDRIQREDGAWESVESYLGKRLETRVTHGMCPDCYRRERGGIES